MASFVMVSLNSELLKQSIFLYSYVRYFFNISSALELRTDSSGGVDSIALEKLIEVMAVVGDQSH